MNLRPDPLFILVFAEMSEADSVPAVPVDEFPGDCLLVHSPHHGFTPGSIAGLSPALGSSPSIYHHGSPPRCSRWEESNMKFLEPQFLVQSRGSCVISETHSF